MPIDKPVTYVQGFWPKGHRDRVRAVYYGRPD